MKMGYSCKNFISYTKIRFKYLKTNVKSKILYLRVRLMKIPFITTGLGKEKYNQQRGQ